ncbi:acyltransferase family protein [Oceanobacillus oncorhynchi]|uniref:acyltransferase family protein n=1 Tax=Oceanobacillus oncorhynchi TaxID=545501 RepID=UPI001868D75B|nr:acyltransferase family protein [Oceanobacillus oncorhynchi]
MITIKTNSVKNDRLLEIDYLRAIACLSVVMLHSIKFEIGFGLNGEGLETIDYILLVISGLLAFGTPMFIVISEILLSYSYPNKMPDDFYSKRTKYMLMPFIFMALFYAVLLRYDEPSMLIPHFLNNLIGGYHGWFILVIFQFYLLHHLFTKYIYKYSATHVLVSSFIINGVYLTFFNFYEPSTNNVIVMYIWDRGYWILFLGWIFYFVVAYYLGKNYKPIIAALQKYKLGVYLSVPLSIGIVLIFNNIYPDVSFGSKRFDLVFLTFSVIATVASLTKKVKELPPLIDLLSRYSFGIYLLHWFFMLVQQKLFSIIGVDFGYFNILIYFALGLFGSITLVYIANKFSFGKYIVGNVRKKTKPKSKLAA